uniref:Histone domain-containing protein n=1 Tax=Ascaris lumbricoides TaxID=6252 RepID=A0A0M3HJC6_ASCLU
MSKRPMKMPKSFMRLVRRNGVPMRQHSIRYSPQKALHNFVQFSISTVLSLDTVSRRLLRVNLVVMRNELISHSSNVL